MPHTITMADVAKAAGVHPSTVSLALRNDPRLPPQTHERIRTQAEAMGYRPNPMVSALIAERRKGQTQKYTATLAYLTAYAKREGWRNSPNYTVLYEALSHYAEQRGYRIEEFWLHEPDMTPQRLRKIFIARNIHGIIVAPLPGQRHTLDFDFSNFAAIALGQTLLSPKLDHVSVDYYDIITLATSKLRQLGHRKLGFVTTCHIDERVKHHSKASFLAEWHAAPETSILPLIATHFDRKTFWQWFENHRPDAIMISTRSEFQSVVTWLQAMGLDIPGDVSLVNLDKLTGSGESGIIQNLDQEAAASVEWLTSRVERALFGLPQSPQTTLVSGLWQSGWSSRQRSS